MLVGLHVATNFEMYRKNSEKALRGGIASLPSPLPPPPPPATLMAGNAKEAYIWYGRESAREARGKFKDWVCLVVFLCWIKRFVLLSLCLKCKYMNKYFSSFQKSRGGRSPPEKFEGGTRPPRPPRDRRLCGKDMQKRFVVEFEVKIMELYKHTSLLKSCDNPASKHFFNPFKSMLTSKGIV